MAGRQCFFLNGEKMNNELKSQMKSKIVKRLLDNETYLDELYYLKNEIDNDITEKARILATTISLRLDIAFLEKLLKMLD